jgi:hypothetical protein
MMKLSTYDVEFIDIVSVRKYAMFLVNIKNFSYDFTFGKAYHLVSEDYNDIWGLSWLIGGKIKEQQGHFELDRVKINSVKRKQISWLIRGEEIKKFGLFRQTVKNQVRQGLKQGKSKVSEEVLFDKFLITPERYVRPMRQLSSEAWRASCAIGVAHGRQIFCFPPLEYCRKGFIAEYGDLWFKEMVKFLKSLDCLVLLPLPPRIDSSDFCDDIVYI